MCGRFTQAYTWTEVHALPSVFGAARNLRARDNVAPTTMVDVVRLDAEGRSEIVPRRWGLVPFCWKQTIKEVPAAFNARAETVHEKPMSATRSSGAAASSQRQASLNRRTSRTANSRISSDGSPILGFACLWDRWKDPATSDELLSCTMIVSGASEWVEPYHDRMPVLLAEKDFDGWLWGRPAARCFSPRPQTRCASGRCRSE